MSSFLSPDRNPHLQEGTGLTRSWLLSAYMSRGVKVSIIFDASPFGIGAVLEVDGVPKEYIADRVLACDEEILGHRIGIHEGRQAWECLTPLVALREWKPYWMAHHVLLSVKGDNLSSLGMVLNGKARGEGPGFVARELALDLGDGAYRPHLVAHVPGVANVVADELSRRYDPSHAPWALPAYLQGVPERFLKPRTREYYYTLRP
jgi:hypothetical protein